MPFRWMLLIIFMGVATTSCALGPPSTQFPSEGQPPDGAPQATSRNVPDSSIPTLTQNPKEEVMTPSAIPETAQQMVLLAKEHLARILKITVNEIAVSDVKPVLWPDASLGCPKPNIDYMRMETPGYSILLEVGGKTYSYHTNQTNRVIRCGR